MINIQASKLPQKLIRRYRTNDPFEIAAALDITVLERDDFKHQKGAFKVVLNNSFIFLDANMSYEMKRIVCAHELGHALLHRDISGRGGSRDKHGDHSGAHGSKSSSHSSTSSTSGTSGTSTQFDFELFDITSSTEYEANLFAANLLLDENDIEELILEGFDVVQIARSLGTNVNLLLLKLQQMNSDNHLRLPDMPRRNFLGSISDDAGHL